ncbi:MAG: CopG family ribbon-helix-helix protein [Cyanobacteria bacterium P01_D01_bin.44]
MSYTGVYDQAKAMSQTEVVTVRLTPELKAKLEALAESTQRSKSWLAAEAIAQYVEQEAWQIQSIEEAVALADSPEAEWVDGEAVEAWLDSWGTEDEQPAPCA